MTTIALTDDGISEVEITADPGGDDEEAGSLSFTEGNDDPFPIHALIVSDFLEVDIEVGLTLDEAERLAEGLSKAVRRLRAEQQGL